MRIVVACPSALADGEKIRQEMRATLCPYMALIRDVLPPTTMNDTLTWLEGNPIRSRMWLVAQVWEVADTMLDVLRKQVNDEELALLTLNTDIARYVVPIPGRADATPRTRYEEVVTVPGVRGAPYMVARYPTNMENYVYTQGLIASFTGNIVLTYPQRNGVYTARTYREGVDLHAAVSDVMSRITDNIKGNI